MSGPKIDFVSITKSDIEQVRNWRNKPRIRQNSLDDSVISSEQQLNWFNGLLGDNARKYFIIHLDGRPVGVLNFFEILEGESCKWGCYIGEERVWPGMGLVLNFASLEYAFHCMGLNKLVGEVIESNHTALKLNRYFEWSESPGSKTVARGEDVFRVIEFSFTRDSWADCRDSMLDRLPEQISRACQKIEFIEVR